MNNSPYKSTYQLSGSIFVGSYFTSVERDMFYSSSNVDLWFGYSPNDVIEISVFDQDSNFIGWKTINQDKIFKTNTLSYTNELNYPVTYSYNELQTDFILYKNESILQDAIADLSSSFNINSGSYIISYNFIREMAGTPTNPLIIKDISPSRTELKLIPYTSSSLSYTAFCLNQFLMSDVSSLILKLTANCPYDTIYARMQKQYSSSIELLKFLFFLKNDGEVITFLKNIYEDKYTYSNITSKNEFGDDITISTSINRRQGIKSYLINYILENNNSITSFNIIEGKYSEFTNTLIQQVYSAFGSNVANDIKQSQKFIYDFFTIYFYYEISSVLSNTFYSKYYYTFKNALNFGENKLLPILNTAYIDERSTSSDPLTLLVKLSDSLPQEFSAKSTCWISNISLQPYIFSAIIKDSNPIKTFKIGSPNFSIDVTDASLANSNISYTANDFAKTDETENNLIISKNLSNLNVDYTKFENFVIFSSANLRLNIFANKINNYYNYSASLDQLTVTNNLLIANSGSTYPYYTQEAETLTSNINKIFESFDGYESYLYKNNVFKKVNGQFISSSYIAELQESASYYDNINRDSLINNCPSHIIDSEDNNDYILFLGMIGQFFDSIYLYISQLPSQKTVGNTNTEIFTKRVVDYMLNAFGWKLDDTLENVDLIKNYLDSSQDSSAKQISSEDRLKTIRNRILINLPQIYKTKGTEESIRLLLACYGIPSSLLSIREFGGINYGEYTKVYSVYESVCMKYWSNSAPYDYLKIGLPSDFKTILFKLKFPTDALYSSLAEQTIVGSVIAGVSSSDISGSGEWGIGFVKSVKPTLGRIFFRIGYKGAEDIKLYSNEFPLFDGNVYSIMLRRNSPNIFFEYSENVNAIPCNYDLYIQRNISGNEFIKETSSCSVSNYNVNYKFNGNSSSLLIGGWFYNHNSNPFEGNLDKVQVWYDALNDSSFNDYVDNINSYSNTSSNIPHESLLIRMHTDYPLNISNSIWRNANDFYSTGSEQKQISSLSISNPISTDYFTCFNTWKGYEELTYNSTSCKYVSQSAYPYQFSVFDHQNTYKISKYGPNKLKNEKIAHVNTNLLTRLDNESPSAFINHNDLTPDSNQIGLFIDPHDFKNKDVIRYFGNYDFMNIIGDPSNQFSSSYSELKDFRTKYELSKLNYSGSKVLYNELISLYKFYFNKSIFESVKNLLPARSNVLTGIVIEPSILERPKYQHKPIDTTYNDESALFLNTNVTRYYTEANTKLVRYTQSIEYGNFDVDPAYASNFDVSTLPSNTNGLVDIKYIKNATYNLPEYSILNGTYFPNLLDNYQYGHFGSSPFIKLGDDTLGKVQFDMNILTKPSGSIKGYLLKRWKNYGSYEQTSQESVNRADVINACHTSSVFLYDYIFVSEEFYNNIIYTETVANDDNTSTTIQDGTGKFVHYKNTFKHTNNETNNRSINPLATEYFEIVYGYPRNHKLYKRDYFSLFKSNLYTKNKQTFYTTVGEDGLENQTSPVETISVSNVNLLTPSQNVINS